MEYGHLIVELDGALVRNGIEDVARQFRIFGTRGLRSQARTTDSGPVSHALASATPRRTQPVCNAVHLLRFGAQALLTLPVRAAHSVAGRHQMRFVWLSLAKSSRMWHCNCLVPLAAQKRCTDGELTGQAPRQVSVTWRRRSIGFDQGTFPVRRQGSVPEGRR